MKLVDILARELKEWPADSVSCVQDADREVRFYGGTCHYDFVASSLADKDDEVWLSDGIPYAGKVTRAQWQAAVDALKVESAPAWVGIGLPPVGTVCEINHPDLGWTRCEIVAHKFMDCGGNTHAIAWINGNTLDQSQGLRFRQIRTPEQITAEERSNAVTLMREIVTHEHLKGLGLTLHLEALYDAGCRFQEAK